MSQSLIFITGATGFIGSHVVTQALAAGYKLRLSVRKESQISSLRSRFSEHAAKLDFVVVPDISTPSAFGQALHGVTYVFHLASPMPGKGSDFESDYLKPAVQGTTALLDAAKAVDTIKRVIIVSSLLALIPLDALGTGKFTAKGKLSTRPEFIFHMKSDTLLQKDSTVPSRSTPRWNFPLILKLTLV